eukprot:170957-Chlamydomonas_euryale.AAC.6
MHTIPAQTAPHMVLTVFTEPHMPHSLLVCEVDADKDASTALRGGTPHGLILLIKSGDNKHPDTGAGGLLQAA